MIAVVREWLKSIVREAIREEVDAAAQRQTAVLTAQIERARDAFLRKTASTDPRGVS